jgi:DNA invertase Pin-like site-specific DNA recombinase
VSKLDRLSRSVRDFSEILARFQGNGWALVAMDLGVDSSTIMGAVMAQIVSVFTELERKRIAERIRKALAVKKASGVRLGRPPTVPEAVVRRIQRQRARGESFSIDRRQPEPGCRADGPGRREVVRSHGSRHSRSLVLAGH